MTKYFNNFLFITFLMCLIQNTIGQAIGVGNGLGCQNIALGNTLGNGNGLGVNRLGIGNLGYAGNGVGAANVANSGNSAIGYGDVAVAGELPVGGATAITGNVPVIGYVTFEGTVPAGGIVSVANNCGCNNQVVY